LFYPRFLTSALPIFSILISADERVAIKKIKQKTEVNIPGCGRLDSVADWGIDLWHPH
jgi:hypothetical protein